MKRRIGDKLSVEEAYALSEGYAGIFTNPGGGLGYWVRQYPGMKITRTNHEPDATFTITHTPKTRKQK